MTPDMVLGIWNALKGYDFHTTHGAFSHMDVSGEVKARLLESMKIVVGWMGYKEHEILRVQSLG